ncbi:Os01g0747050 [Oryza sativa Japonica Group]|uniref:Os01g0747050 protein n=1 Tax=Oryza sativa subsp. japonica TaxID=39947 RepID=A0A0P0V834_ORYSJ|nr:Os01g0747050 [Oryza sativa Japonica Group]
MRGHHYTDTSSRPASACLHASVPHHRADVVASLHLRGKCPSPSIWTVSVEVTTTFRVASPATTHPRMYICHLASYLNILLIPPPQGRR